jgi:hypothetical protein
LTTREEAIPIVSNDGEEWLAGRLEASPVVGGKLFLPAAGTAFIQVKTERRMSKPRIPPDLQFWIAARERHRLSHAQVQMARELGMNPRKLGKLDNHKQETWKLPLPQYIEKLYLRRFGKTAPDEVVSIEERARRFAEKKAKRKAARAERRETGEGSGEEIR